MIGAIVLGAGASRRMGRPKLLLPYGSSTVIEHIVEQLESSEVDDVSVVVGHEPEAIRARFAGRAVRIVENRDHAEGMLSSVRCGLRALPKEVKAVLVALGDQPAISSELVDGLIYAYRGTEKAIVVPCHNRHRGHPLLFSARFIPEILRGYDEVGLRGLIRVHEKDVFEFPVLSPAVLSNMNTPDDYEQELNRLK